VTCEGDAVPSHPSSRRAALMGFGIALGGSPAESNLGSNGPRTPQSTDLCVMKPAHRRCQRVCRSCWSRTWRP
jgi:hypothetical protein